MSTNTSQLLYSYLASLFKFAGIRLIKAGSLLFLSGMFQGFSLLMLIPLLSLTGLGSSPESTDVISTTIKNLLSYLNISYSLIGILGIFLFFVVSEAFFTRYRSIVLNELNLDYTNNLRNSLYQYISSASWEFHSSNHSSESMHLLDNAVSRIGEGTYYILQIFIFFSQAIVFLFVASSLSISMTLVMLFTAIVLYILVIPVNKKVFRHGEKAVKANQALYRNIVDFFGGLKLAKSFNRTNHHIHVFKKTAETLLSDEKAVVVASASAQMWLRILTVSMLCLFVFVALKIMNMGIERLLVLIVLVNRLYSVFSSGQNHWQALLQTLPSFDVYNISIQRFKAHQESHQNRETLIPKIKIGLRLKNVSFTYQNNNDSQVISNLTFDFPAYKTTAIVGESGVGKSTLVEIIMGLLIPDSGKIFADDNEITSELLHSWRTHIAYVPQENYLFDGSIRSNMQWVTDNNINDEEIWLALDTSSAGDFVRKLPQQLDTLVGERGVKLSGGERQRIALARALLKKPDLLILDEATSALDHQNEERVRDALLNLHGSMMIIIIAHRVSTIKHADSVLKINKLSDT